MGPGEDASGQQLYGGSIRVAPLLAAPILILCRGVREELRRPMDQAWKLEQSFWEESRAGDPAAFYRKHMIADGYVGCRTASCRVTS